MVGFTKNAFSLSPCLPRENIAVYKRTHHPLRPDGLFEEEDASTRTFEALSVCRYILCLQAEQAKCADIFYIYAKRFVKGDLF